MGEVLNYISIESYKRATKNLKSGEEVIVYEDKEKTISLMREGRKIYNIIVEYGNIPITEIARNLLVQA